MDDKGRYPDVMGRFRTKVHQMIREAYEEGWKDRNGKTCLGLQNVADGWAKSYAKVDHDAI